MQIHYTNTKIQKYTVRKNTITHVFDNGLCLEEKKIADEEPLAPKACKYMANFITLDNHFLLSKDQTDHYDA